MALLIDTQIRNNLYATGSIQAGAGFTGSFSGSLTGTSSWASNVATSPYSAYVTLQTGSTDGITCSFADNNESVTLNRLSGSYTFTASNMPSVGQVADVFLYISQSTSFTSSLNFPASWVNLGAGWPTSITASKVAIVWLRAMDNNRIMGTYNVQL